MIHLVIIEELTPEGKKNFKEILSWHKKLDQWLKSHGAIWRSVRHFITEIGEPFYETWLEYPDYSAIHRDDEKSREFAKNPEFIELASHASTHFRRITAET